MAKLTYNLDLDGDTVLHVLNLDRQRVFSRVFPSGASDEQDGVHVAGADVHQFRIQRSVVFKPGHNRTRFSLTYRTVSLLNQAEPDHLHQHSCGQSVNRGRGFLTT